MINDKRGDPSTGGMSTSLALDDDGMVPMYGFGDARSRDQTVISVSPPEGVPSAAMALQAYRRAVSDPAMRLSGPTCISPLIDKAIELVKKTKQHHMLLIIADGQLTYFDRDMDAVKRA